MTPMRAKNPVRLLSGATPDVGRSRCGAKTRQGTPCSSHPVTARTRCRMHGGASTGPRTPEGLERIRAARTKHGGRSAAAIEAMQRMRALLREARALLGKD
jgi:hypothetical protein